MALIDSTRHMIQKGDTQEDSMETDAPRSLQKDQRDSVSVSACVCVCVCALLLCLDGPLSVSRFVQRTAVHLDFKSVKKNKTKQTKKKPPELIFLPLSFSVFCCIKVCVLALHLSKELCRADEDGEQWLQVMRKLPVLPSVLSALELSLRSKHNLYFTEAALHLLLTLARTSPVRQYTHHDSSFRHVLLTCCYDDRAQKKHVTLAACQLKFINVCLWSCSGSVGGSSGSGCRRDSEHLSPSSQCV